MKNMSKITILVTLLTIVGILSICSLCMAAEDTWTRKANMPTSRDRHSCCAVDGKIYAVGGIGGLWWNIAAVEVYDPVTDTWVKKTDMPTPKFDIYGK
jgi:hypothetical protein